MVMVPLSFIFFSVPSSSSALTATAAPPTRQANNAIKIAGLLTTLLNILLLARSPRQNNTSTRLLTYVGVRTGWFPTGPGATNAWHELSPRGWFRQHRTISVRRERAGLKPAPHLSARCAALITSPARWLHRPPRRGGRRCAHTPPCRT